MSLLFLFISYNFLVILMKEKIKTVLSGTAVLVLTAILIIYSSRAKAGAIKGSDLCANIIIPSLLTIMILTSTLSKSKFSNIINRVFAPLSAKIFHLPPSSSATIIFGLTGGYPTGAVLTRELYRDGLISAAQARRIMHFNISPGLAFSVNAVGSLYNDNFKTGWFVFFCCVFSSLTIAFIEGLFYRNEKSKNDLQESDINLSDAFFLSVNLSAKSILVMSCCIIFFSSVCEIIKIPSIYFPLFEITNGVFSQITALSPAYLCFFMCFSGLCIHMQITGIVNEFSMKYGELFLSRCVGAIIAFFPGKAYALLHPETEQVFGNIAYATPKISSVGYGFSLVLILGCIVITAEIKSKKSKLL